MLKSRLDEDLEMLGDMREAPTSMLTRVKTAPDLREGDELTQLTAELIKSLGAEIQALERTIAGTEREDER